VIHEAQTVIPVTPSIELDESEIQESFIRSSGPGGQNVNKVSSAVQIRFDVRSSPSLPHPVRRRLEAIAGSRMTQDGVLVITAQTHRSQDMNRKEALARLLEMIRKAATPPVKRRATRPTLGSKERRLEGKSKRSTVKKQRGRVDW
jgi:ribosome-associated protein